MSIQQMRRVRLTVEVSMEVVVPADYDQHDLECAIESEAMIDPRDDNIAVEEQHCAGVDEEWDREFPQVVCDGHPLHDWECETPLDGKILQVGRKCYCADCFVALAKHRAANDGNPDLAAIGFSLTSAEDVIKESREPAEY